MASGNIFISYKREERDRAEQFAEAFRKLGWSVWVDSELRTGEGFDDRIQYALDEASCVVVLWSPRSAASDYVRDEAAYALDREKLVPVSLDHVELPFRFHRLHTTQLSGWNGDTQDSRFQELVHDIARFAGPPSRIPQPPGKAFRLDSFDRGAGSAEGKVDNLSDPGKDPLSLNQKLTWLDKLPVCDGRCSQWVRGILILMIVAHVLNSLHRFGMDLKQWDLLLLTGIMALYLGVHLAIRMPRQFARTIGRLADAGVLCLTPIEINEFLARIEIKAKRFARIAGLTVASCIILAFVVANIVSAGRYDPWLLGALEAIGGYIAGTFIGRMVCYGQLGRRFQQLGKGSKGLLDIDPSHADGVSGLKPIGQYYLKQAFVAGIPALFLALWLIVFLLAPHLYPHWQHAYIGLLALATTIEIAAFFVPLWSFHRIMNYRKQQLLLEADLLTRRISKLERATERFRSDTRDARIEIEAMQRRYSAIKKMKTWPLDVATKGQFFSLNTLLVCILTLNLVVESGLMTWVSEFAF